MTTTLPAETTTPAIILRIRKELRRLGAGGAGGIEVGPGPRDGTATFFDTAITATYESTAALAALAALVAASADGWPGGGFEAAWQAIGALTEAEQADEEHEEVTAADCPAPRFYVETRASMATTGPGSRWERTGPSTDGHVARSRFAVIRAAGATNCRLVRLDWDPDGDEDSMPTTTIVEECLLAAVRS